MSAINAIYSPLDADLTGTVAAGVSTGEVTLACRVFAINATNDINIRFGNASMGAASASNFRIPAGTTATYSLGQFDRIRIFSASGATYWIQQLG